MSNIRKFNEPIRVGLLNSAPSNPVNGMIYYDSSNNQFKTYENGQWKSFGDIKFVSSVTNAENTEAQNEDLIYVAENESFYRYNDNANSYTVTGTTILNSNTNPNGRWFAIAGKYSFGPTIIDSLSSAPSSPTNGMIYYDDNENRFKIYENNNWKVIGDVRNIPLVSQTPTIMAQEGDIIYVAENKTFYHCKLNTGSYNSDDKTILDGGINDSHFFAIAGKYSTEPITAGSLSSAPSSPEAVEGMVYYDSNEKSLKVYKNGNWKVVGDIRNTFLGNAMTIPAQEGDVIYVTDTESFYRFETNGGAYTANDTTVIDYPSNPNARWLAIAGKYILNEPYLLKADLQSTDNSKGASLIKIEDASNQFTSDNVEGALDEALDAAQAAQADADTNAGNITTNATAINGHLDGGANKHDASEIDIEGAAYNYVTQDTDLESAIGELDSQIKANEDDISTNAGNITSNTTLITNHFNGTANKHGASDILTETYGNYTTFIDVDSNINALDAQVSTNHSDISTNASNISTNASNISTNSSNISSLDSAVVKKDGSVSFTGDQSMGNNNLTNLADPVNATDAVNKQYVDGLSAGLDPKASCRVATTENLVASYSGGVLTANAPGAIGNIDGIAVIVGDRVLVKDQNTLTDNGIYTVTSLGDGSNPWVLTRATDMDGSPTNEVSGGNYTFIEQGTTNKGAGFVVVGDGNLTVGTSDIVFTQFSDLGDYTAGSAIDITNRSISVNVDNLSLEINSNNIAIKDSGVTSSKIADNAVIEAKIGSGAVTVDKIGSDAVTAAKINSDVAGTGLVQNASTGALDIDFGTTGSKAISADDLTAFDTANKGANLIGIQDADGNFTATTVEGALKELNTNTSNSATKALDNLENVALNTDLLPDGVSSRNLGSSSLKFYSGHIRRLEDAEAVVAPTSLSLQAGSGIVVYPGGIYTQYGAESKRYAGNSPGYIHIANKMIKGSLAAQQTDSLFDYFSFNTSQYLGGEYHYTIKENVTNNVRVGVLNVVTNGTDISLTDTFNETSDVGISWTAAIVGSSLKMYYTSGSNDSEIHCDRQLLSV